MQLVIILDKSFYNNNFFVSFLSAHYAILFEDIAFFEVYYSNALVKFIIIFQLE